jgi:hypothetical protein
VRRTFLPSFLPSSFPSLLHTFRLSVRSSFQQVPAILPVVLKQTKSLAAISGMDDVFAAECHEIAQCWVKIMQVTSDF